MKKGGRKAKGDGGGRAPNLIVGIGGAAAVCKETSGHKDEMIFGGGSGDGSCSEEGGRRLNLSTKD